MAVYPLQPGETRTVALIRTNRRLWPVGAARSAARTRAGRGAKQPPLIIQKPRIGSAGMWAEGRAPCYMRAADLGLPLSEADIHPKHLA
jgi:hypothetical protein